MSNTTELNERILRSLTRAITVRLVRGAFRPRVSVLNFRNFVGVTVFFWQVYSVAVASEFLRIASPGVKMQVDTFRSGFVALQSLSDVVGEHLEHVSPDMGRILRDHHLGLMVGKVSHCSFRYTLGRCVDQMCVIYNHVRNRQQLSLESQAWADLMGFRDVPLGTLDAVALECLSRRMQSNGNVCGQTEGELVRGEPCS
jgi:hypothetical protein